MTTNNGARAVSAHPAAWGLAHGIVEAHNGGSARLKGRILDAIEAVAPPHDPWPDPWRAWSAAGRAQCAAANPNPIDPAARAAVLLSPEQADWLRGAVEAYESKAPGAHARAIGALLDALEAAKAAT